MTDATPADGAGTTMRQLTTPEARTLADLASTFEDLTFVMSCCERLLTELARDEAPDNGADAADAATLQAHWCAALVAYVRCFATDDRPRGLTVADLTATPLEGKVVEWHRTLRQLRDFVVGTPTPHETFSIGAAEAADGSVNGIAIVAGQAPVVDEVAVRETGRLAFELSRLVDQRIKDQQQVVFEAAGQLGPEALAALPMLRIDLPADG